MVPRKEVTMHAVLITYRSTAELDALVGPFTDHARAIAAVPGLVAKTWLRDGATLGGFYLFTGRAAAETYLDGALVADLAAHPAFAQFRIRHYGVLEELSRLTGSPQFGSVARGERPMAADAAEARRETVARGGDDEAHRLTAPSEESARAGGGREH